MKFPLRPPPVEGAAEVRVVAPAGAVRREELEAGIALLEHRFRIGWTSGAFERHGYLAGDDDRRAGELQSALDDPGVGAVLAARGGYGTTRIIDRIALDGLGRAPRWIAGSSDLTALLLRVWSELGLVTAHGPMVASLPRQRRDLELLCGLLAGGSWRAPHGLEELERGAAEGPLLGGNLAILAHLCGTIDPDLFEGAILLLEEVGERPYRVDRYLVQLERSGVLERVAGFLIGELTGCESERGPGALEVMAERLCGRGAPVAAGYPAAHGQRNVPFPHGAIVRLEVGAGGVSLGEKRGGSP
ncbi:MAG: LD-carboxypeptidase [Polyangia bacterium]